MADITTHHLFLIIRIKKSTENVNVWEHYHDVVMPSSTSSVGSTIIHMEPYGDLQLHPNYGTACQVSVNYSFSVLTSY